MANWGIYGFPEPEPTRTKKPRLFNVGAPFADEVLAHFRADFCFKNVAMTEPCSVGDHIQACQDLSGNGRHATGTTGLPTLMIEDGFPAIQTSGNALTVPAHAAYTQVAIFRAPSSTFNDYGAVLGRVPDTRPYLFRTGGNYFHDYPRWSRINGIATFTIAPIDQRKLMVIGLANPSTNSAWYLGQQTYYYNAHLIIFEVVHYAGDLTADQIAEVEAFYLEKYKI